MVKRTKQHQLCFVNGVTYKYSNYMAKSLLFRCMFSIDRNSAEDREKNTTFLLGDRCLYMQKPCM